MKIVQRLQDCAGFPFPVVTIGNFDGFHLGHRAVIECVRRRAKAVQGTTIVLTFDPHPLRVLAPQRELQFLSDPEDKLTYFEDAGVDLLVCLPFTHDFAMRSPEEFMVDVLVEGLGTRELYVGGNFRFGRDRQGTIETLMQAGPRLGFTVEAITPVLVGGERVSSTRIRALIQSGAVGDAAVLLGRPYTLRGSVIEGAKRGTELGFPTANIQPPGYRVLPPDGVYATHLCVETRVLSAVTYIGRRPTFGGGARLIETYLLDEGHVLYGQVVGVAFYQRLRGDRTFDSSDSLARQIAEDVEHARDILKRHELPSVPPTAAPG